MVAGLTGPAGHYRYAPLVVGDRCRWLKPRACEAVCGGEALALEPRRDNFPVPGESNQTTEGAFLHWAIWLRVDASGHERDGHRRTACLSGPLVSVGAFYLASA